MSLQKRPKYKIELTNSDLVIEIVGVLLLIGNWILIAMVINDLPAQIPTHFNLAGKPDAYSGKHAIIVLPIISSIIFIGLTFLNKYPHVFNYPVTITVDNAERQYTVVTKMMRNLKTAVVLLFSLILLQTVKIALGYSQNLSKYFILFTIAIIFLPTVFFIIKSIRAK